MTEARFIQIHTLHSYSSVLLNRDDTGLAKRLPYGGLMRTRISSQCLKRHWRIADEDPHSLLKIGEATKAFRSRELVTNKIIDDLRNGGVEETLLEILEPGLQRAIYGKEADKGKSKRQTLLFGEPETTWITNEARNMLRSAEGDAERLTELLKTWEVEFKANIKTMRERNTLPAGLASALFGRMVTSDTAANIDAPIHVAHAFTVHQEETESDYLTAVDDLKRDEDDSGADTIQETELTSGLFYGYVVIDVPGLVANTTGRKRGDWLDADRSLAAEVVHNLLYLIAEVTPGAKLGSTAPYGRAELVLAEAGDRQPRSLSAAYRVPARPVIHDAVEKLGTHLTRMDELYETGEARRVLHVANEDLVAAPRGSLREIAEWAKATVIDGAAR